MEHINSVKPGGKHSKKSCHETKYADDYVTMTRVSPYAHKRMSENTTANTSAPISKTSPKKK